MSDSRVDKLTAHYARENAHPDVTDMNELRKEAIWHIADIEAAGLVVIDPDDEATKVLIVNAVSRAQGGGPLAGQDEYSQRLWMTVGDHVTEVLRRGFNDPCDAPSCVGDDPHDVNDSAHVEQVEL